MLPASPRVHGQYRRGDVRREHDKNSCRFGILLDRVTSYRANVINARFARTEGVRRICWTSREKKGAADIFPLFTCNDLVLLAFQKSR